jgi:hypothetical protein
MIRYFDHSGYKLLDQSTGTLHKSRDVIFEESRPHYSTNPIVAFPSDDFAAMTPDGSAIAPHPKHISHLHPTIRPSHAIPTVKTAKPDQSLIMPANSVPVPHLSTNNTDDTEKQDSEGEVARLLQVVDNESIMVRRPRRETRMTSCMKESLEYLNQSRTNVVTTGANVITINDETYVPKNLYDAMK